MPASISGQTVLLASFLDVIATAGSSEEFLCTLCTLKALG